MGWIHATYPDGLVVLGLSLLPSAGDTIKSVPGLFAYWSADNAVVSGGAIIRLPDLSGNVQTARDLTPVTTGPTYTAVDSTFNNRPSISSSTANIRMQATFDTSLAQGYTVYLVMNVASNAGTVFWRSNAGNNVNSAGYQILGGPAASVIATQDSALALTSVGSVTVGNKVSCCIYDNANTSAQYLNDSANTWATSPGDGNVDSLSCSVMTIGNFGTANIYAWTTMALYAGSHNAVTRKKIMSYLGNKYSIAVS